MTLINGYLFNENDSSNVSDYSSSGNHATSVQLTDVSASQVGFAADFERDNNDLVTVPTSIDGDNDLTLFVKLKFETNVSNQTIINKDEHHRLIVNGAGLIAFEVYDGTSWNSLVSVAPSTGVWITYTATWKATTQLMVIYKDGVSVASQTVGPAIALPANGNDINIGSNSAGANSLDALVEVVKCFDAAHKASDVDSLHGTPTGYPVILQENTMLTGDVIGYDLGGADEFYGCVALSSGNKIWVIPWSADASSSTFSSKMIDRFSNVFDDNRKWCVVIEKTATDSLIKYYNNVVTMPTDITNDDKLTHYIGKNGFFRVGTDISADATMDKSDHTYYVDSTSVNITINLPASPVQDEEHMIVKIPEANTVIVDGNGNNMNGSASDRNLTGAYDLLEFKYDGNEWIII